MKQLQQQFAAAIRDPKAFSAPSSDHSRRIGIYQSLFFNNVRGFLHSAFPVIFEILPDIKADALIRDFFVQHACSSPYFVDISKEFVEYLSTEPEILSTLPEFIAELAHYEWLELAVSVMKCEFAKRDSAAQEESKFSLSPLAALASYFYPVHLIGPDFQPKQPSEQPQCYVVYRDLNENVQFLLVTPITLVMLSLLEQADEGLTSAQLKAFIAEHFSHLNRNTLDNGVEDTLSEMLEKSVIVSV